MILNPWFDVDSFFADLPRTGTLLRWDPTRDLRAAPVAPAYDLAEGEDSWLLRLDLPGVALDDVAVTVDDGTLVVRAERKAEPPEGYQLVRRERGTTGFERRFSLGRLVDVAGVTAAFDRGVLSLTLPKRAEAKPQRIEVRGLEAPRLEEAK